MKRITARSGILWLLGVSIGLSGCPKKESAPTETPPGGMVKKTDIVPPTDAPKSTEGPKEVALKFAHAVEAGDMATIKAISIPDPQSEKVLGTFVPLVSAMRKLRDAAAEKFGEAGKQVTVGGSFSLPDTSKMIRDATLQETGDVAALSVPQNNVPLVLKKIDGVWKVDLVSLKMNTMSDYQVVRDLLRTKLAVEGADDIRAGKYPTAAEATAALESRYRAALPPAVPNSSVSPSAPATPTPPPATGTLPGPR